MVNNFKKFNKMACCTQAPWAIFINPKDRIDVLRKIRQECLQVYGYLLDECPNRLLCIKKQCVGRPLPFKSKTALPFLIELAKHVKVKNKTLFIDTDCSICEIYSNCSKPCNQVLDFIERKKTIEPYLIYKDTTENLDIIKEVDAPSPCLVSNIDIPWDILNIRKTNIIKKYIYDKKDFESISNELGVSNKAKVKYELYSGLTKLSEYAIVRQFFKNNQNELSEKQKNIIFKIYFENKTQSQVANDLKISKQAVNQMLLRLFKKYKLKIPKFAKKVGKNRIVYNTLKMFL